VIWPRRNVFPPPLYGNGGAPAVVNGYDVPCGDSGVDESGSYCYAISDGKFFEAFHEKRWSGVEHCGFVFRPFLCVFNDGVHVAFKEGVPRLGCNEGELHCFYPFEAAYGGGWVIRGDAYAVGAEVIFCEGAEWDERVDVSVEVEPSFCVEDAGSEGVCLESAGYEAEGCVGVGLAAEAVYGGVQDGVADVDVVSSVLGCPCSNVFRRRV